MMRDLLERRRERQRLHAWRSLRQALRSARMTTPVDPRFRSPDWRVLRALILERDGYVCQIRAERCQHTATQVDHITSVVEGGAFWDERNLRAACQPCNGRRGQRLMMNRTARYRYRMAMPAIESRF